VAVAQNIKVRPLTNGSKPANTFDPGAAAARVMPPSGEIAIAPMLI